MSRKISGKIFVFSTNGSGITGYPHAKEWSWDTFLDQIQKNHSRWITDLNVRGKITKLLEENICVNYCDSGLGNGLSDMKSKAQEIKLGFIKTKNLCVSKDIKTVKRKPTGENNLQIYI